MSGMSLNEFFGKSIFIPLGLKNISMFPALEMRKRLAFMHKRATDGTLTTTDHTAHNMLRNIEAGNVKGVVNSGGAGCFSTTGDYCGEYPVL